MYQLKYFNLEETNLEREKVLVPEEDLARQRGRRETLIWAFRENTGALRFYEKHGYQQDRAEYLGPPYLANGVRFLKYI